MIFLFYLYAAKSLQSCPTLCNPMDCSPPGYSIHGIFQARVLEWSAIAFSFYLCIYIYTHIYKHRAQCAVNAQLSFLNKYYKTLNGLTGEKIKNDSEMDIFDK